MYRDISQEDAAEIAKISRALLSKIENGLSPYNQDQLERLAFAYGVNQGELLARAPDSKEGDISLFDLPFGEKEQVINYAKALKTIREQNERENGRKGTRRGGLKSVS